MASNARKMLSRMHLSRTNHVWDDGIQWCNNSFIWLAYTLATILYKVFKREIGLKFWILCQSFGFGKSAVLLTFNSSAM